MVFLFLFNSGCWVSGIYADNSSTPVTEVSDLPDDINALMAIADEAINSSYTSRKLGRAAGALEKAEKQVSAAPAAVTLDEIHIKLAIVCFWAGEIESKTADQLMWFSKGEDAAEAAARERPDRVEGHYYLAVIKGRKLEQGGIGGLAQVSKVEALGKKAAELDPSFENGGPFRLLAMLYAKTPPWPTSIGDVELAIEYANKAVKIADYPLNYLIMAEVLIEAEEFTAAKSWLKKVLAAPKIGKWSLEGEFWRPYASQLLRRLNQR